jgi:cobalt/nickel transport system permease protein
LSVAIPAMVIPHMVVASVVEGLVTALVVAYLQRANQPLLEVVEKPGTLAKASGFGKLRALWIGLGVLIVATPLGLLAPGTAWGEWSSQELAVRGLGFVPEGLAKLESLWGAPLARYDLPALGNANLGYVLSAVLGIVLVALVIWLFTLLITPRQRDSGQ